MSPDERPSNPDEERRKLDAALARDAAALTGRDGLRLLGLVTDLSSGLADGACLERALKIADIVLPKLSEPTDIAELHFFLGNVWEGLRTLRRAADEGGWAWDQPELVKANRAYRTAYTSEGFSSLHRYRKCQILTNIGNQFDHLGRFVEAIEYWDHALAIDPNFAMAIGNRGMGLWTYARHLYDPRHATVFVRMARAALTRALERPLEGKAGDFFHRLLARVDQVLADKEPEREVHFREFSLGRSKVEVAYRRTCLMRRLFLNPLNDLGYHTIAARDILVTPPMKVPIGEGPRFQGFFNQLKQEYASARYLFFEGSKEPPGPHFSDREVVLFDTFDYPVYGLGAEQLKLAFRMSYSILDKVAFFLNEYFRLGIPERNVKFRTLWFANQRPNDGLRPDLASRTNLPFRGLYWVSRDLAGPFDPAEDLRGCLEPEARELAAIRNHLEHKYLKLHELGFPEGGHADTDEPLADTLAYSINRTAFEKKSLKMLKLARAAIMYVSFAIHREERQRAAPRTGKGGLVPRLALDRYPDEWKR